MGSVSGVRIVKMLQVLVYLELTEKEVYMKTTWDDVYKVIATLREPNE